MKLRGCSGALGIVTLLLAAGCGSSNGGGSGDGGTGGDTGTMGTDSGMTSMEGGSRDSGTTDTGTSGDSGNPTDSGMRDGGPPPDGGNGHAIKTVFLILMENNNWSSILGSSSAPYINNTILPNAAHAEQYYNPPSIHPSEPNYIWLEAGDNLGITDDSDPATNHQSTTMHLVTLMQAANVTWKAYEEDITAGTCPLVSSGNYAAKHNPFVFFDDVTNTLDPMAPDCIAHEVPYTQLASDLTANAVAQYNFITPNLCDDMHNSCAPTNDGIRQGDDWLSQQVPMIQASQAYMNGGVILITWDEGEGGDGPIGMIALSPLIKMPGYSNTIHYTHSSTLRTMQEVFGVTPFLRDAANATDLSDFFTSFP